MIQIDLSCGQASASAPHPVTKSSSCDWYISRAEGHRAVPAIEAVRYRARDVLASVLSFEAISNPVHNDMSQTTTIVMVVRLHKK